MRRGALALTMGLLLAAGACGPAEVVVTVEVEMEDPASGGPVTRALSDIEVQVLPYDRDQVFDSLTAAFGTPEPPVPQELIAARDEVRRAQEEWDNYQRRWSLIRDTLQALTSALDQYSRGEAQYVALYREWQDFDSQLGGAERNMEAAFARFDSLQRGTLRASDSVGILQDEWADQAFADAGDVFLAKQRAAGLDLAVDTTDASGIARGNLRVKPGSYWIHARYELPYSELYWNVPVTVERGEPVMVRLTRENAEERIKL